MTIDEVIRSLKMDASIPSRFPVRLIFIESLVEYIKFVEQLKSLTDKTATINIGNACVGDDKYPSQFKLDEMIAVSGESIVLLSVSEYLRICLDRELGTQNLFTALWEAHQSENSKRRIIIPLFSAKELFERLVPKIDPRQADHIYTIDGKVNRYDLIFCAPCFERIFKDATRGIKSWLLSWSDKLTKQPQQRILTALITKIQKSASAVYVDKQDDVFAYLKSITKESRLVREWGTEERWTLLAAEYTDAIELGSIIDRQLQMAKFIPLKVLATWKTMADDEKWMAWLRFRLTNIDGYIAYVFKNVKSLNAVETELRFAIFDVLVEHPAWIDEYREAMRVINPPASSEFISRLNALEFGEIRLALLTCGNHEEKAYAIKIASEMIRNGEGLKEVSKLFIKLYPEFAVYLDSELRLPKELRDYFKWYIQKKVENRFESRDDIMLGVNLDNYDSRNSIVTKILPSDNTYLFWLDGMGAEWLPLFLYFLDKDLGNIEASYESTICSARIPTETEYNEQWKQYLPNAEKYDKLDKLAHNGMPDDNDYYSCIASQLEIIRDFVGRAVAKLRDYNSVVVSADHGSSRVAAMAFHAVSGITVQGGGLVGAHGRYCEYATMPDMHIKPECAEYGYRDDESGTKKHFFIMTTHDHFSTKGRAVSVNNNGEAGCGEIHGGKSPEEYLVPVIVIRRKQPIIKTITKKSGLVRNNSGDM